MTPGIPTKACVFRLFAASTHGVAALEFAMIMPILAIIFLTTFDGGRAIAVYMKVRSATYALAAIANQYSTIQSADMNSIVGAASVVLAPYSSTPTVVTISQLSMSNTGKATVSWSYSLNGAARLQGAAVTLPSNLQPANNATCSSYPCYLILAEVSYTYTPVFGLFTSGTIALSDNLYVTPRSAACVLYPPGNVTSC
jgi:Flp pilus assembly protein TadG